MKQMLSLDEILTAVDGQLIIGSDYKMDSTVYISGVSRDTRTLNPGELFVAHIGKNYDGHSFCSMALEKGASALLVSDASFLPTTSLAILVEDTRTALGKLANCYRTKLSNNGAKVIVVTGQDNKSDTKLMINHVIENALNVYSTDVVQSDDLGLSLSILSAPLDVDVVTIEFAVTNVDDISYLAEIASPDIIVISNVNSSGEDLYNKCKIIKNIIPGGVIVIDGDDLNLADYIAENTSYANVIASATVDSDPSYKRFGVAIHAKNICEIDNGTQFDIDVKMPNRSMSYEGLFVRTGERKHIRNAIISLLCSSIMNIDFNIAKSGLSTYNHF